MIRKFRHTDLDQVVAIWLETSIMAHDFIDQGFWRSNETAMREVYLPAAETYVFENSGEVQGFVSLVEETIAALFVSPRHQGVGIGTMLLLHAKSIRSKLTLTVYTQNSKSIKFYRTRGFQPLREQTDIHTGHPELVMVYQS